MSNSPGPEPFVPQVLMNLPSLVNHDARVGVAAMAVGNEDVAVRRGHDGRWRIELIGTAAGGVRFAERHQDLAVGAELENLVAFAAAAEPVGHPHVALAVDVQTVREQQQAGAEALQQFAGRIEFEDRIEV